MKWTCLVPQGFPVILIFKLVCTLKKVYDTTAVKNDRSREINKVINKVVASE